MEKVVSEGEKLVISVDQEVVLENFLCPYCEAMTCHLKEDDQCKLFICTCDGCQKVLQPKFELEVVLKEFVDYF